MALSQRRTDDNPARLYLARLSEGTRVGMRHALDTIADFLSDGTHDAESFAWWGLRYRDTAAVRSVLAQRYKSTTVNKMLSALRGVLKQAWKLRFLDADSYQRAIDIKNLAAEPLMRGRALSPDEVRRLFDACAGDASRRGRRDAAILAVLYGCGVRRAELTGLDIDDFDEPACSMTIRNGKRCKQRTVYLSKGGCGLVEAWILERGKEPGPLFCPLRRSGGIRISRLRGESVAYILRRRQQQAGTPPFSPHDLRRTFVSTLLAAGVDVFTVQRLAGHADANTTARYDRRGEAAKREAALSLRLPLPRPQSSGLAAAGQDIALLRTETPKSFEPSW